MITLTGHYSEESIVSEIQNTLQAESNRHIFQMLNPRLEIDGNQWSCIWGDPPKNYIAGFGDTPHLAIQNFVSDYYNQKVKSSQ